MLEVKLSFYLDLPDNTNDLMVVWNKFKETLSSCNTPEEFIQWRAVDEYGKPLTGIDEDF